MRKLNKHVRRALVLAVVLATPAACVTRARNIREGMRETPLGRATVPLMPPAAESDEATAQQLLLASDQGHAVDAATDWLVHRVAAAGGEMPAGEYHIAYAVTPAEGWYEPAGGATLAWHDAGDANAHLAVVVRDGADGRLVPGVAVHATIAAADGRVVDERELPFGWAPLVNEYGDNISVPAAGVYSVRLRIAPPPYWRHDPVNGDRFADTTVAEFDSVRIDPAELARRSAASDLPADSAADSPADSAAELTLARAQGDQTGRALYQMAHSEATDGVQRRVNDYIVAFANEFAETYWEPEGGSLVYRSEPEASAETNAHFEVSVRDARTGRFLPGLTVHVTLMDGSGRELSAHDVPLMWHPWIYHYGRNWRVPRSGDHYRVRVRVDEPPFRRWGRGARDLFTTPIDVTFEDIRVRTGEK